MLPKVFEHFEQKHHIINQVVRKKKKAATGEYDELLTMVTKTKVVWPCLKVFRSSKDHSRGHIEWKNEKETDRRRGGKKSGQGWTLPAQLGQLKTGQDGKGLLRSHLWCHSDLARL